jgi:diguanylate cyclase (GGDEF)-like protein
MSELSRTSSTRGLRGGSAATGRIAPATKRGRILAVGPAEVFAMLGEACGDRAIVRVSNLYEAVGELSNASPRDPIGAVLIDAGVAARASERAIESIRRFDPAVRIIVVADSVGGPTSLSLNCHVDHHVAPPLTPERIEVILNGDADPAAGAPGSSAQSPRLDHSGESASVECELYVAPRGEMNGEHRGAAIEAEAAAKPQADAEPRVTDVADSRDCASAVESSADVSPAPTPARSSAREPLGDVDLVEAVMHDPNGVRESAIAMIEQQTGWQGVTLLPGPTRRGIAVVHDGAFHGTLIVPNVPRDSIEPWAQWLGCWMSLDESHRTNRLLAETDALTGAWNRRYFQSFLTRCISRAAVRRRPVTVMVFDIDDFKLYNDQFGHAAGDEILRETVRLLKSVIRQGDRVCRIGGDEFAVIFADIEGPREPGSDHPHNVEHIAQRFQNEICQMHFPKLGIEAPGTLSISAGLATFPWDGRDAQSLLEHADQLALESKRRGKNAITLGPGAQKNCSNH